MEKKDSWNFIIIIYIFLNLFNKSNLWFFHPKIHQKEQRERQRMGTWLISHAQLQGHFSVCPNLVPSSARERLLNGAREEGVPFPRFAIAGEPQAGLCGAPSLQKPKGGGCDTGKKAAGAQAINRVVLQWNTLVCCSQNILISAGGLLARWERCPGARPRPARGERAGVRTRRSGSFWERVKMGLSSITLGLMEKRYARRRLCRPDPEEGHAQGDTQALPARWRASVNHPPSTTSEHQYATFCKCRYRLIAAYLFNTWPSRIKLVGWVLPPLRLRTGKETWKAVEGQSCSPTEGGHQQSKT